jgi:hypothetical protein
MKMPKRVAWWEYIGKVVTGEKLHGKSGEGREVC